MRKIIVLTFLSLDGVMQAPGGKGEDPSGNFDLEGWTVPYFDQDLGTEMGRQMDQPFDLLLGRKTYDIFAAYWPDHVEEGAGLNAATKYVVSNNTINTNWNNTVQISGNVVEEIKQLRLGEGPMVQVHGSSQLLQTLLQNDLIDEFWLKLFPVVIGKGKRLFGEGTVPAAYKLTDSSTTPSGVILAKYERDGDVKVGSFS
jgi:dihydrofolate reductase